MAAPLHAVVGRDRELDLLRRAVSAASNGAGLTVLLLGEAGAGKSRLLEESAQMAAQAGLLQVWGRCWEAGEAPAFWPWTQVLRSILRHRPTAEDRIGGYRRHLFARLLPELSAATGTDSPDALFELLEAVTTWLCEISHEMPLWIGLEDLHAADAASIALLDHLLRQVHSAPIVVIGAARESDLSAHANGDLFRRAVRDAQVIRPAPLPRSAIATVCEAELGSVDSPLLEAIQEATDGNPLFVVELLRWLAAAGPDVDPRAVIPPTVRATIAERLERLPQNVRTVLAHAALVGRQIDSTALEQAFGLDVPPAMQLAAQHSLVRPSAQGWRFSHGVVADVLAQSWEPRSAETAHEQYADWLAQRTDAPCAEIAYHYRRAGETRAGDAERAFLKSAQVSLAKYAYDDALRFAEAVSEKELPASARIVMGLAHIGAGRPDEGCRQCHLAFEAARQSDDGPTMAQAALAYGSVYRFAEIDTLLVGMLQQALAQLGGPREGGETKDSADGLRARVMGRLAAAQQPADDVTAPIALAQNAIAEARAAGHDSDLLATLRAACSALIDVAPPDVRRTSNQYHLDLALRLRSTLDILQARTRLAFDMFELGEITEADDHIESVITLCDGEALPPRLRWRGDAFRALRALWREALDDAEHYMQRSLQRGNEAGDANARTAYLFQRSRLALLRQDHAGLLALEPDFATLWPSSRVARALARTMWAGLLLEAGETERARTAAPLATAKMAFATRDHTILSSLVRLAGLYEDTELARGVVHIITTDGVRGLHRGVVGMTWDGPVDDIRARAERIAQVDAPSSSPHPSTGALSLKQEGDVWRLAYEGRRVRMKSNKGLRMLARLVEHPGQDVHVFDLVHLDRGEMPIDPGDGGEVIDAQARQAYQTRAAELQSMLDEAEAAHDLGRIESIRQELETLTETILSATGLSGRARRTAGAEERARQNVRKRLKDALRRISEADPTLGRHLERSIKTGRLCRYDP